MWFSYEGQGWYSATMEGILRVTHCPYCGYPLPDLASAVLRALKDEPLPDPEE